MNQMSAVDPAGRVRPKVQLQILDARFGAEFPLPKYETVDSAGMDLRAMIDEPLTLNPGDTHIVSAGFAMHIADPGLMAVLVPRSGLGSKHGIVNANLVGIIDSGYVGQIGIALWNRGQAPVTIQPGDRVSQMVIVPVVQVEWDIVPQLTNTERGTGSFGSTGVS